MEVGFVNEGGVGDEKCVVKEFYGNDLCVCE
jgi:hypothetical protein